MRTSKIYWLFVFVFFLFFVSCEDDLKTEILNKKEDLKKPRSLREVKEITNGIYARMLSSYYYGRDFIIYGVVRSDIAYNTEGTNRFTDVSRFNMLKSDRDATNTWLYIYNVVNMANHVIYDEMNPQDKESAKPYKAQAYALRALAFFDLVRLYGQQYTGGDLGIPLKTNLDVNEKPKRNTLEETYKQIEEDFLKAIELGLSKDNENKSILNETATKALLSRYYLYRENWDKAIEYASEAIAKQSVANIPSASNLEQEFASLKAKNTLFHLGVSNENKLASNSMTAIYNPSTSYGDIRPVESFYNTYSDNDARKGLIEVIRNKETKAIEAYLMLGKYPKKEAFGLGQNSIVIMRLEEVYLNRAEAYAQKGNTKQALEDLNVILQRRSTNDKPLTLTLEGVTKKYNLSEKEAVLEAVRDERKKELAFEGHRFFDLLRYGKGIPSNGIRGAIPQGDPKLAFPIPVGEMNANPNMVQNAGY